MVRWRIKEKWDQWQTH